MDFRSLVDSSVKITAKVGKIDYSSKVDNEVLVLSDICVNGIYFRDHTWIRMTKKLSKLVAGDLFSANATLIEYPSIEGKKLGLKSFRNVLVDSKG